MLGIENQGCMHHLDVQRLRLLVVQRPEEVLTDGVGIGLGVDTLAVVGKVVPVVDDRREHRQHAVDMIVLLGEVLLGFQIAQH